MRAMVVTRYGDPLEPLDVEEPTLMPGHALVEIATCSICYSDVKTIRGKMPYSETLQLPHVPGHEICGRIVATDPVGAMEEGTLVVVYHLWSCGRCARCRAGDENICTEARAWVGFTDPGGFQERIVVPLDRLAEVPPNVDPIHAAPMTCALGTAYRSVVTRGGVRPGDHVVVIGLGGVGIHALQIARSAGGHVVGLDPSERARNVAADMGLTAHPANDPESEPRIAARTKGGADVVIDVVGRQETIDQAYRLVRPGGRIVTVGYTLGGHLQVPSARTALEEIEVVGSRYMQRHELHKAISLVASGAVQTVIDSVRPLEEANDAIEAMERGEVVGRAVLDVTGTR